MKSHTYLRLSLLLPYALWAIMALLASIQGLSENTSLLGETVEFRNVGFLAALFLVGIFFWFIPYTLLVLGLLLWSRKKEVKAIVRVFALSPIILTALILLEVNVLSILLEDPGVIWTAFHLRDLMSLNLLAVGLTLGIGYFCIALGFGLYKLLQKLHIIKDPETEFQPLIHEAA